MAFEWYEEKDENKGIFSHVSGYLKYCMEVQRRKYPKQRHSYQ